MRHAGLPKIHPRNLLPVMPYAGTDSFNNMKCKNCGSYAINRHLHGRDGSRLDLCDVCYWRDKSAVHGRTLTAFAEELESTADGNTRYATTCRKRREFAAAQNAIGTVMAFRWCAKRLREISLHIANIQP